MLPGALYTRKQIWPYYQPEMNYPGGGDWFTGYTSMQSTLVAFANIDAVGRTGHNFPTEYNSDTGEMTWYGKPNAHSTQPTFKNLLNGLSTLNMFVRWNSDDPHWYFLGQPQRIISFKDGVSTEAAAATIQLKLLFGSIDTGDEMISPNRSVHGIEGQRKTVLVNRYERDPKLRSEAIRIHGSKCMICGFDFERTYGDLGANFCHIHHLSPLSEIGKAQAIDPKKDLIPVCPNCHAMLHRKKPAYTPKQLQGLLKKQK